MLKNLNEKVNITVKRWVFQERSGNSKRELNETLEWKNTASEINSLDGPKRISFTIQEGSLNLKTG